ncbi:lantibiotic dehydratase C-terminal domain-containing protein [Streptomyces sp. DSM 42041]|uniref:Lantibiotic dehydratase C-terminal domain-containing protein n=1 Tax=Streptomyces hazeniae TaxID=3075538 RepID=A0ABU2NTY0_9ACTN|nr:lantibiotic dehydratase C-terminal domain-containing protein [Streptomyces sp. DSM 42041]MDT0379673.1 lantibiotic dehydratase C-terminal domain-containing protein [Streptomyces sp. DSM 42041]
MNAEVTASGTAAPAGTDAAARAASGGEHRGAWQATHVFYAANPRPLLLQCVRPLVRELDADGLLANWFFINYWLEGPHVRLRVRPSSPEAEPEVRRRTEEAIDTFLAERPALYEVDTGFLNEFYNALFDIEFPDAERSPYTDDEGRMNLRPNNSRHAMPYDPEYAKYGGPAGIELAEWHFRYSSELVLDAFRTKNLHLRTVLLGTSAQLMMVMAACFLPDEEDLADFLDDYYHFWHKAFPGTGFIGDKEYENNYAATAPSLSRMFGAIRSALAAGEDEKLPDFLAGWAAHCRELRDRVRELAADGALVFGFDKGAREKRITDPDGALKVLLSPYMHMTNNRLHVTIRDEAYLSHVLHRVLREDGPGGAT